ncbi:VanZ family protein [Paenibacillus sp. alder61]|uniref:VanZ family protein n=1 Tax=Paenibacillus sp. alder61 TaxID=2862948 RepID=UPI001CD33E39|nr:VanZ family protein [Paenibacillus sp. alder61]MCA1292155.1 VanZ family protein [Paenibacillus sp. alder61]
MDLKLNRNRERNPEKPGGSRLLIFLFYLMFIAYALIAIKVILFKTIPFSALLHSGIMPALRSINIIPFNTIIEFFTSENIDMGRALANIGGNIAIFVPLGIFVAYAAHNKPFRISFLCLLLTSFALEVIQYVFALGSSDIDDILLNFAGGAIGVGIYKWFRKTTSSQNQFLMSLIGFFLVTGLLGGAVIKMIAPDLLPFSNAKVEFIYENKEVMAGWDEAKADLVGDLAAVEGHEVTLYMNPKLMRTTDEKRTAEEYVHIQINDSTRIFSRLVSSDKNTVITKYEEVTGSDMSSMLTAENNAPSIMVWLSNEDKQVAEAILISVID